MGNIPFVLSLVLVVLSSNFEVNLSVDTEQSALLALKAHVTDDPQNLLATNWSSATSICKWIGVACGSRHHRVTALNLSGMGLKGTIPPHLGNLSFLASLNVSCNSFHGSLPIGLSSLRRLKYIDFGENNFCGEIPSWFGSFTKLGSLVLDSNNFTGVIPSSLGNLSKLEELKLFSNSLNGHIPAAIGNLSNLIELSLQTNQLSGDIPADLFDLLPKLKFLYLDSNNITSRIPSSLFKCKELEQLFLSNNSFEGSLPIGIRNLTALKVLYLHMNNLQGPIPLSICNISSLERIALGKNKLSAGHFSSYMFDNLPQLQLLGLSRCQLSGRIPTNLFKRKELQFLFLSDNLLEGSVPAEIGRNLTLLNTLDIGYNNFKGRLPTLPPSLNWFSVTENELVGEIPSSICNLSLLEVLGLSYNDFNGTIPQCLGNLSSTLLHIDLGMNDLHGIIPDHFPERCSLRTFSINSNQLEGTMPQSLLNCKNLKFVNLGNNKLNDTFPNWLANLELQVLILRSNRFYGEIDNFEATFSFSHLQIIDLSDNGFTGYLPRKLFQKLNAIKDGNQKKAEANYMRDDYFFNQKVDYLVKFSYAQSVSIITKGLERVFVKIWIFFTAIDFSNNRFSGLIPEELGELHSLILLNLSHNSLTGPIPSLLGNLSMLESLDLSSNKLQGRIPVLLKNLIFLAVLNLSDNDLSGPIPRGNQFDTFTSSSYNENLGLCGFPLTNNCSEDLAPPPRVFDEDDDVKTTFNWKFAVIMGYGCGLIFGLSMGYIVFTCGKPLFFIKIIQRGQEKCFQMANIRRKWNN